MSVVTLIYVTLVLLYPGLADYVFRQSLGGDPKAGPVEARSRFGIGVS